MRNNKAAGKIKVRRQLDAITLKDSHGARRKLAADDGLDVAVALHIDGRSCLVKDENLRSPQQRALESSRMSVAVQYTAEGRGSRDSRRGK